MVASFTWNFLQENLKDQNIYGRSHLFLQNLSSEFVLLPRQRKITLHMLGMYYCFYLWISVENCNYKNYCLLLISNIPLYIPVLINRGKRNTSIRYFIFIAPLLVHVLEDLFLQSYTWLSWLINQLYWYISIWDLSKIGMKRWNSNWKNKKSPDEGHK